MKLTSVSREITSPWQFRAMTGKWWDGSSPDSKHDIPASRLAELSFCP
ncbi:MAG: hypothetical protein K2M27_09745 [Muribaculaceae bacterium]|nr:hypothetical protein [Muribaculaceae bacterium]